MAWQHRLIWKANDPKTGMTVGELFQFVQECGLTNVDPRTPVFDVVGFRGQVKELSLGDYRPPGLHDVVPGEKTHPAPPVD